MRILDVLATVILTVLVMILILEIAGYMGYNLIYYPQPQSSYYNAINVTVPSLFS